MGASSSQSRVHCSIRTRPASRSPLVLAPFRTKPHHKVSNTKRLGAIANNTSPETHTMKTNGNPFPNAHPPEGRVPVKTTDFPAHFDCNGAWTIIKLVSSPAVDSSRGASLVQIHPGIRRIIPPPSLFTLGSGYPILYPTD